MPLRWDKNLYQRIKRVAEMSTRLGIPSIEEEDGIVIQSISYTYALRGADDFLFLDLGAGIGYSTLWLLMGAGPVCEEMRKRCRVVAVERDPVLAHYARKLLGKTPMDPSHVSIDVVEDDATTYLESVEDCSVDIAFVDIDKSAYAKTLRLLAYKLKPGGLALFHNAFVPKPPTSFFEEASKRPWLSIIVPTSMGILVASRTEPRC